tara:strand:- start:178 stop:318 length:141 start_codon:yes stop_codon:yes gene_type:complete
MSIKIKEKINAIEIFIKRKNFSSIIFELRINEIIIKIKKINFTIEM